MNSPQVVTETKLINSSYNKTELQYGDLFRIITWMTKPKRIVEFGLLEGYSLHQFAVTANNTCCIEGYDIFEKFNGNAAKRNIQECFVQFPNVKIQEGDFYTKYKSYEDNSIDILHIDIANDGHVYEFAFEYYLPKLTKEGIMILEGGSEERDNVEWMIKYKKQPILHILEKFMPVYDIFKLEKYPSCTCVRLKH